VLFCEKVIVIFCKLAITTANLFLDITPHIQVTETFLTHLLAGKSSGASEHRTANIAIMFPTQLALLQLEFESANSRNSKSLC